MTDRQDTQSQRYQEATEWLFRLQDDQSTEQIERWIEWCCADPENQQAFERLMPLWQVHSAMPQRAPAVPQPVSEPVATLPARRRWPAAKAILALAAAAAVVVAVVGLLPLMRAGGDTRLQASSSLTSTRGETRTAQLTDGSQVALGAQSRIAVDFDGGRRAIEIEGGEAFFTVQHDRSRPFVVGAGRLQIVAVGTAFDVDRRGRRVSVTVQEGTVEVADRRSGATTTRVPRGSQLIFDESSDAAPTVRTVSPESADAWRRGRFEYVAEPLSSVIEDLNRYASERIVLQGADLGDLRYSGTIDLNLIEEWLRALPSIFAVDVRFANDHQVILSVPPTAGS